MNVGLDEKAVKDIVGSYTEKTRGKMNEIHHVYRLDTDNFQNGGHWDLRYRRVKQAGLRHELVVITQRRGIWKFVLLLDYTDGTLYVFSKEKNLEKVIKDLGKKSIHYFHAFVALNEHPVEFETQLGLFARLPEDYEDQRIKEARKILEQNYSAVKQVVFVTSKHEGDEVTSVEAKLYTPYFELVDKLDWTEYIAEDQYEELFTFVPEADETIEDVDNEYEIGTIPKVKKEIKDRKKQFDEQIPNKKSDKDENKEEEQS